MTAVACDGVRRLYADLFEEYGPQRWWPAQTAFEVVVGAVLTQNTSWRNVERAMSKLRAAGALAPGHILDLPARRLFGLLRPSGCFRVKARRLRALCAWWQEGGGYERLAEVPTESLRASLLEVHGVGAETADAILLYAFGRPVFVVDAYARRLLSRVGIIGGSENYDAVRVTVESRLGGGERDFNEFHALIVEHCKRRCRKTPLCAGCRAGDYCARSAETEG